MPHSNKGYEPYQQMFGCKDPALCDHWWDLNQYEANDFVYESSWVKEQAELMTAANRWALESIQKSAEKCTQWKGDNKLNTPKATWLLWNPFKGQNRIQDN